jgi:hypothetical protein
MKRFSQWLRRLRWREWWLVSLLVKEEEEFATKREARSGSS